MTTVVKLKNFNYFPPVFHIFSSDTKQRAVKKKTSNNNKQQQQKVIADCTMYYQFIQTNMDGWDQDRISVQTLTQNELLNNIIPSLFFAFFFLSNNNV